MVFNETRQTASRAREENTENANGRDTSLLRLAVALSDNPDASAEDPAFWIGSIVWEDFSIPQGVAGRCDLSYGEPSH